MKQDNVSHGKCVSDGAAYTARRSPLGVSRSLLYAKSILMRRLVKHGQMFVEN